MVVVGGGGGGRGIRVRKVEEARDLFVRSILDPSLNPKPYPQPNLIPIFPSTSLTAIFDVPGSAAQAVLNCRFLEGYYRVDDGLNGQAFGMFL